MQKTLKKYMLENGQTFFRKSKDGRKLRIAIWKTQKKKVNGTVFFLNGHREFIEKYSDKPWNWHFISMNQNLTMKFIEKYPDKSWSWYHISHNKFTYENKQLKKKEAYWLLEGTRAFNKTENLVILSKYM